MLVSLYFSCQRTLPKGSDMTLNFGKIKIIQAKQGQQIIIVADDGEQFLPSNWKDFESMIRENTEFQFAYTEVAYSEKDSSLIYGKPIILKNIEFAPEKLKMQ